MSQSRRACRQRWIAGSADVRSLFIPAARAADNGSRRIGIETLAARRSLRRPMRESPKCCRASTASGGKLLALRSYLRSGERPGRALELDAGADRGLRRLDRAAGTERRDPARARGLRAIEPGLRAVREPAGAQPRHPARELESQRVRRRCLGPAAAGRRARISARRPGDAARGGRCSTRSSSRTRRSRSRPWRRPACRRTDRCAPSISRCTGAGEIVAGPDTHTIGSTWEQGGWAAEARCCGARGEPQVHRTARFAAGALALHLHPGRRRRPVAPRRRAVACRDVLRFDPRRRSATMRAYSFIRN